jgi:hypothetical protein
VEKNVLAAAESALAAYSTYLRPHTPYMEHFLFGALCGRVGELFEVLKTEPLLFFGPGIPSLSTLQAVGDAAREVYRLLTEAAKTTLFPDLGSEAFRAVFGDLEITAAQLRDEVNARKKAAAGPHPLTPHEQAVLERIPFYPNAIREKALLSELARAGTNLDHSTLTSRIIPQLKRGHGVRNRRSVGYYRLDQAKA